MRSLPALVGLVGFIELAIEPVGDDSLRDHLLLDGVPVQRRLDLGLRHPGLEGHLAHILPLLARVADTLGGIRVGEVEAVAVQLDPSQRGGKDGRRPDYGCPGLAQDGRDAPSALASSDGTRSRSTTSKESSGFATKAIRPPA